MSLTSTARHWDSNWKPSLQRMRTVYWSMSFSSLLHRLLSDDSHVFSDNAYRLLRQDLFQRFGPLAGQIPTEPGMVKMPLPSKRNIKGMCSLPVRVISLRLTDATNPKTQQHP